MLIIEFYFTREKFPIISKKNVFFSWKTFRWYIHSDPGVMSIRLRDLSHPMLKEKLNIDFFQPNKSLVLHGKFVKYDLIKSRKTINIIGASFQNTFLVS